ncbi:hypothetical protein ACE6H2_008768 [Prunus campanulata]
MALPRHRGAFNIGFQLCVAIGVLSANLINFGAEKITGGWGLIQSSKDHQKAKSILQRTRGCKDVQAELDDLIKASENSKTIKHPFKKLMKRKYRPQLVVAIAMPFFTQVTGINVISFYAPVLFRTLGLSESMSLLSAVMSAGMVGTCATFISMLMVDKLGRRTLFAIGGIQMFVSQVIVGSIMAAEPGDIGGIRKRYAYLLIIFVSVYVVGFAWSWGPLGWLIPSEIFPLEFMAASLQSLRGVLHSCRFGFKRCSFEHLHPNPRSHLAWCWCWFC